MYNTITEQANTAIRELLSAADFLFLKKQNEKHGFPR